MNLIPHNDAPHVVLQSVERRIAEHRANAPIAKPETITDKTVLSRHVDSLLKERRILGRKLELLKRADGHTQKGVPSADAEKKTLAEDATIGDYLEMFTEDRNVFGGKKAATDKKLVDFLKNNPEAGTKLGGNAMPFRLKAQIHNTTDVVKELDALLADYKKLPNLSSKVKFKEFVNKKRHDLGWWVKDNPIGGACLLIPISILVKLTLFLVVVDVVEGGHGKHKKKDAAALPVSPQQRPLALPGNAYAQQQPAQAQSMSVGQALAYPAPFLGGQQATSMIQTPLQTALNMG